MPSAYSPLDRIPADHLDQLIETEAVRDQGRLADGRYIEVEIKWAYTLTHVGIKDFLAPSSQPHPVIYFVGGQGTLNRLKVVSVQYKDMYTDAFYFSPYQLSARHQGSRDSDYPPEFVALCHTLKLGTHKAVLLLATAALAASMSSR